jgi:hypothetical protein
MELLGVVGGPGMSRTGQGLNFSRFIEIKKKNYLGSIPMAMDS